MKKEHLGSDFDDFLQEEQLLEVAEATAVEAITKHYRKAYPADTGLDEEFEGWEAQGSWPKD